MKLYRYNHEGARIWDIKIGQKNALHFNKNKLLITQPAIHPTYFFKLKIN